MVVYIGPRRNMNSVRLRWITDPGAEESVAVSLLPSIASEFWF